MLQWVNWIGRGIGFAWLGVLAFLLAPPHGAAASGMLIAGYSAAGLAMVGWALLDFHPAGPRYRRWAFPLVLGLFAAGSGLASAAGAGATAIVALAFVATMVAGGDTDLPAALAVTATGVLATAIGGLIVGVGYGTLLGLAAIIASGLIVGRNRAAYRIQAEQSAALLAQREQLESQHRRADLLDERSRIAREIHDVLAHSLGALAIQIQAARSVLTDRCDIQQASELLASAQRMAAEGLVETRRAVHALRVDTLPLDEELERTADEYAERYRVAVSVDTGGVPRPLPPEATVALLRIAQEGLVNAAKHATGQSVTLRLDYTDADVRLTVRNALGAAASAAGSEPAGVNGGYGLTGMAERLRLLNGTLEAGRRSGEWVVIAQLPDPQPAEMSS
ncbi:MAG TPA: histidine kinase [Streptosporangiaceae bacterium]